MSESPLPQFLGPLIKRARVTSLPGEKFVTRVLDTFAPNGLKIQEKVGRSTDCDLVVWEEKQGRSYYTQMTPQFSADPLNRIEVDVVVYMHKCGGGIPIPVHEGGRPQPIYTFWWEGSFEFWWNHEEADPKQTAMALCGWMMGNLGIHKHRTEPALYIICEEAAKRWCFETGGYWSPHPVNLENLHVRTAPL